MVPVVQRDAANLDFVEGSDGAGENNNGGGTVTLRMGKGGQRWAKMGKGNEFNAGGEGRNGESGIQGKQGNAIFFSNFHIVFLVMLGIFTGPRNSRETAIPYGILSRMVLPRSIPRGLQERKKSCAAKSQKLGKDRAESAAVQIFERQQIGCSRQQCIEMRRNSRVGDGA
ncbi:hypothetical protein GQ43DRAFT_435989 [Delitschia confertaspora ATCC 74209]|uniref:Uncharacterized protein n=1 Tax=Delitschia confertaspora ATCC 74209 TaxID=1513339 RepID=A0A9P4JH82_9PLEO|nr:hypothetical protein GQ43DRAFT_435989 [Delitschia confertaspora ATCC 74209]